MIKVLIADDEAIIRRGLMSTVQWDKYNMRVVADVPNGKKGWEAFLEHRPEVIITDIVMPEMNGIELAQRIKEHSPKTKVLLLSCHRDFEYAQQGLNLGASGYLLKTSYDDRELEQFLAVFERDLQLTSSQHQDREIGDWQMLFVKWLYGINDLFVQKLPDWIAADWHWMQGPNHIYLIGTASAEEMAAIQEACTGMWISPEHALFTAGDQHLFLFFPDADQKDWEAWLCELKGTHHGLRWSKSGVLTGIDRWIEAVRKLHHQLELEKQYQISVNHWPEQITKAVQMIISHVDESLSVTDVACEVGLSRSHFSTMFKKIVGESFISFTYRVKLKIACELLGSTKLNIQQISDKVGMPDVKYFSKWFKRCTLETPSQYRSRIKTLES